MSNGAGTYDVKALSLRNVSDVNDSAGALRHDAADQAVHDCHHVRMVLPAVQSESVAFSMCRLHWWAQDALVSAAAETHRMLLGWNATAVPLRTSFHMGSLVCSEKTFISSFPCACAAGNGEQP